MKIVVIGGTGLIGSRRVAILRQGGHEVIAASPKVGVNKITADGLKEALAGAQLVIDLSNSLSFDLKAVLYGAPSTADRRNSRFSPRTPDPCRDGLGLLATYSGKPCPNSSCPSVIRATG